MKTTGKNLDVIRLGLSALFKSKEIDDSFFGGVLKKSMLMFRHPFNLSNKLKNRLRGLEHRYWLLAWPGYTDASVDAMIHVLRYLLNEYSQLDQMPLHLRVIRAEHELDRNDPAGKRYIHWVWFEVADECETFICGGCNDFSSEGGAGRIKLERIFAALSRLDGITFEEVVIPMAEADPVRERLMAEFNDSSQGRSAA